MVIFGDVCGALRQKGVPGELFFTHFLNQSLRRWGWFRFLRCWMNPPPAKGKARRKPCTEKPSARFDEEREVGRPLFYSTVLKICGALIAWQTSRSLRLINPKIRRKIPRKPKSINHLLI